MNNLKVLPFVPKFVEHKIASSETEAITAVMFEYLMAGNGVFIRAKRREFSVCLPVCREPIKGLPEVEKRNCLAQAANSGLYLAANFGKCTHWLQRLHSISGRCFRHFLARSHSQWCWKNIGKERQWARTIADDSQAEYGEACIELHTHPDGVIHFSSADDRDESGKFRLFGILIDVHTPNPKIRFRCGVYDYFAQIPADYISEMPEGFLDLNKFEQSIRKSQL